MIRIIKKEYKDLMNGFSSKGWSFDNLYVANINESLDILHLLNKKKVVKTDKNTGDKYIKDIIEVSYQIRTEELNNYELRLKSYKDGFDFDGTHYVRYKRGDGMARKGCVLFINEKLYSYMMKWCGCGLDTTKPFDLAGYEAYISKTLSDCIKTFNLDMKNILIMKDYYSKFTDNVIRTDLVNGMLQTDFVENQECENNVWDGQGLMDESIFEQIGYGDKSCLLLRNEVMTKVNVLNTKIQKYYKDNNITLKDIKNSEFYIYTEADNVEDIKLILLPSDIKYSKFGTYEQYAKLLKKNNLWGVVKYDKPTKYYDGELVNTHYQLLNSIDMNKNDVKEFMSDTRQYVKYLKQDLSIFNNHINNNSSESVSQNLLSTLMTFDKRVQLTKEFTSFSDDTLKGFKNNLKKGHIWTKGNYSVLTGNTIEMLKASCGKWDKKQIIKIGTVYNKKFDFNKRLLLSRSPHVGANSIYLPMNTYYEEIDKYFNFGEEIIVINAINENTQMRLGGADFDVDSTMVTDNPTLIRCALKHYYKRYNWVSYNNVSSDKKKRVRTAEELADLDYKTSHNNIGNIINLSQILISILNQERSKGNDIDKYALLICKLNAMSMLEIDKAKKEVKVDLEGELFKIQDTVYQLQKDFGLNPKNAISLIKPLMFKEMNKGQIKRQLKSRLNNYKKSHPYPREGKEEEIKDWLTKYNNYKENSRKNLKSNYNNKFVHFDTTMDFIVEEIDNIFRTTRKIDRRLIKDNEKIHSLHDLLNSIEGKADYRKLKVVIDLVYYYKVEIDKLKLIDDDTEREIKIKDKYNELYNKLPKSMDLKTMEMILRYSYKDVKANEEKQQYISRFLLSVMYNKYNATLLRIFKRSAENVETIKRDDNGNINIYGILFKK